MARHSFQELRQNGKAEQCRRAINDLAFPVSQSSSSHHVFLSFIHIK